VKEADLDTTKDDGDLAAGHATGSNPGGTGETAVGSISFQAGSDALVSFDFAVPTGITVTDEDGNAIAVDWSIDGSGQLVGTIGGSVAIVLAVNGSAIAAGATGTVTVTATLTDHFPHADGGTGKVSIGGIQVVATDTDGTQATATIGVTVVDDAPVVTVTGTDTVEEGAAAITGSWSLAEGADGVADTHFTISVNGGAAQQVEFVVGIDTGKGILTINEDHTWSFKPASSLDNRVDQKVSFELKAVDGDGDARTASHTITITMAQFRPW